ncbi:MAG: hypothetical protein Q9209_003854 [Squamulea sp. 1 TL-2023]
MAEPIAVIGSGCRFPGGADTPSKLWSIIHHPQDLSRKPSASRFNIDSFYHPVGTHHGTTNATKSYWLEDNDRSNVTQFDAGFFNIQPGEVNAMDPQQRLLMEVVYDSLCAAGQPMEKLRGSDTSVYVGSMCDDYNTMLTRDWETLPRYTATGLERGILANRISYFFDWRGPSLSVDTACSSSLVALDHAIQTIRSGTSRVAVAAGTSLILSPAMYISESNLGMLSPSGRCAMWDSAADGYTRGEGVAAVVLKALSQALADNDPIDCVIRASAINQDGRTAGLTVPSGFAQADLIRLCYAKAGLDPVKKPEDRPQFFQAHGTGTQAGDPQEAMAISDALFPAGSLATASPEKLLVGSIKTVIGHTEGTAGLASLISTSLALKQGVVPPNLHFHNLSAKVAPFFKHLEIPTAPTPWPSTGGDVRRASVNSFGFGGTNAHCILETFIPKSVSETSTSLLFTPLIFSAASATALRTMLTWHLDYVNVNPDVKFTDLAYTLQHRRSTLPYRKTIAAKDIGTAMRALQNILSGSNEEANLGARFGTPLQPPRLIGIFTGQGAQWPRMGAEIVENSSFAASRIAELDAVLGDLHNPFDRPSWTLRDQLLAVKENSRIAEAALSQPLCTAVQIILVDVLKEAGISFAAVVGHSSGEIGAAYAAGFVSAEDAIRIAYFRGVHARFASSPNPHAPRGAMMAIGVSFEDAMALCLTDQFTGRIQVAAVNSSSSVTLSGDEDAIDEAGRVLKAEGMFARKLKIDTAYHSAHMASCAKPYLASLASCGIRSKKPPQDSRTTWFSSVYQGTPMTAERLTNQYWADNMCNTVLFTNALTQALQYNGVFDMAIEIGPHPALQGPATATLNSFDGEKITPYTGLLSRGQSDIEQLSAGLGFVWSRLGLDSVRFSAVQALLSGSQEMSVLQDLPPYPFDHQRSYWMNSRIPNHFRNRSAMFITNPVLGNPCSEAITTGEYQWRKILQPGEMPWLKGHMLQGQTVFPATGYVSMAVEAIKMLVLDINVDAHISLIKLEDVDIPHAIAFDDDSASVETIFSVSSVTSTETLVTAGWACYSAADGASTTVLNARGRALCHLSPAKPDTLPLLESDPYNLVDVDKEHFYGNLSKIGYDYASPFRGLSHIRRKLGYSVGALTDQSGSGWDDDLVLHPGMLDSALQTVFAAWSYPGDTSIWSLHVPVSISAVTVNPYFTPLGSGGKQSTMRYESFVRSKEPSKLVGDIYLHTEHGSHAFVWFEGATLVPFSRATPKNDLPMFSHFQYKVASPDGQLAAGGDITSRFEVQMYKDVDRAAYWFARNVSLSIPPEERHELLPHFQKYLSWCDRMVDMVSRNGHPKITSECNADSRETIAQVLAPYKGRKDIRFVEVVGDNLISVIRAGTSMLEHMNQDGLLRAFYEEGAICSGPTGRWLARVVSQISHRYPGLNIFEVGAGTGATTSAVLRELGDTYTSYTFTDISSGFFIDAEERFSKQAGSIVFKTFNMEKEPSGQGFIEGLYDVVVAVNVLHVSSDMEASLSNVRRLLKPGGFLVVAELTSTDLLFSGMTVGTLPGWWIGAETGRPWGPLLNLGQWDSTLKKAGFGGIDTITPDISTSLPMNVFVAQAVSDQVKMLRNPLTIGERPVAVRNDVLAIIGGTTLPVYNLGQDIARTLSHRFLNKEFFATMEDYAASQMSKSQSVEGPIPVLSLVDLDRPYLEDLTVAKFDALKTLWAMAGTVIWVTCGSRKSSAYSYMMKGIINTVRTEHPNLSVQMYDLEPGKGIQQTTASHLALTLLREHILHEWGSDNELLWTSEPEVSISEGHQLIPRLLPDHEKNDRYNSQRRTILTTANPAHDTLELVGIGRGKERSLQLHKVSPLRLSTSLAAEHRTIRITHSLLQSLAVGHAGFLRLCIGIDENNGEAVLAFTGSSESLVKVSLRGCISLAEVSAASTLISVANNLLADHILSLAPRGSTLLVNQADLTLQAALQTKSISANVDVVFTTAKLSENEDPTSIFLHPNFPQYVIKAALPPSVGAFFHFSRGAASDAVRDAIVECLPPACLNISEEGLLSHEVRAFSEPEAAMALSEMLQKALDDAPQTVPVDFECIRLEDVVNHTGSGEPLAIVDWTASSSVTAQVQTIDSGTLFQANKTYLFVGMAGELGQSLAEWMIKHGARNMVLASRTPKVNRMFVEDMMKRFRAVVKPMPLDVTSRQSIENVLDVIAATLPPVGGIVNGAMVLEDELFANMTLENFSRVTAPKVLGTQLLDQAFHDDASLEFFIVTSSIASIIGWTGQSNYSAANEWMQALVFNRQMRGVPASTMNIPAVVGVGYAAHADNFDFDYFESLGYINICEEDLHALFAEAMLSGRPGQDPWTQAQVGMGVNFVPADLEVKAAHKRDVKFNHFVQREEKAVETQAVKAGVRVKVELQMAKTKGEASTIIHHAFVAHIKRLLRITGEGDLEDSIGLVDQGVDSLVAVDIRAWFLKELGVDVPTLKILGGGSINDLVGAALEKIPELLGPASSKDEDGKLTTPPSVSTVPVPELVSSSSGTSSSSGGSRSPVDTPASTSRGSEEHLIKLETVTGTYAVRTLSDEKPDQRNVYLGGGVLGSE